MSRNQKRTTAPSGRFLISELEARLTLATRPVHSNFDCFRFGSDPVDLSVVER
jgi:hypothetical protein